MKIILISILMMSWGNAWASNEGFAKEMLGQLNEVGEMVENLQQDDASIASWQMSKIRLRMRAKVGLQVPWLAKLELKPMLELHYVPVK